MLNVFKFKNSNTENKVVDLVSHLFFLLLIVLAIFYREERLLSDAAYYFFRVVNNESFWVEHDRYILIFSQLAPWIGSNLGIELNTIILLSSIGHVGFFYGLYLIIRYVYKDLYGGLILLSIQFLGITTGFFVPMFEFYYAMGFLVLFHVVFKHSQNKFSPLILIALAFFIITAHFYAIILFVYTLLFYAFDKSDFRIKKYLPYALLIVLFILFKTFVNSTYEKQKTAAFLYGLANNVYDFEYMKSWIWFIAYNYWDWALLVFVSLLILLLKKKYVLLLGYSIFLIGFVIVVNVSSYGFELSRYKEQVNFSLMFLSGFTFVYCLSLFPLNFIKYGLLALVSILFIFRFYTLWDAGQQFSSRLAEMKKVIDVAQQKEGTKFIVSQETLKTDANWSYPIESLIFSSVHYEKCVSIGTEDDFYFSKNNEKIKPNEYLFRRWEIYDVSRLNPAYFSLDHSTYKKIKLSLENT